MTDQPPRAELGTRPDESAAAERPDIRVRADTSIGRARGALALGAMACGALALGALAIGGVAVGVLAIGVSRIRKLHIEELDVKRLRVRHLDIVSGPGAGDAT